jgi:hypothetical protein
MTTKTILSTGDSEKDAELLKSDAEKETLVNKTTFEEDLAKFRASNKEMADPSHAGHNALTEQPHIEGQVIAVVADTEKEKEKETPAVVEPLKVSRFEQPVKF